MSIPNFSVKNHVLVNMMMIVILIGGAIFAFTLVKEMFPESRPNKLAVTAIYPANQPEQIEKAITIKVEEAVRDIDGIEKVDSSIQEGVSTTVLTLYNEVKDVDTVLQEVQAEIDAIENLPDKMERITVRKLEPRLPVISVALFGDGSEEELKRAARNLRDDLLLLPGITDVHITGTREDEISVEIRPDQLEINDVTFDDVATAIRETNLDVSAGQLKGKRQMIAVRTKGEKLRGRDLENIVVRSQADGSKVTVGDVATVRDAFVESDLESYFNAKRSVNCTVYKSSSQDAVQIAMLVRAFIAGKQNADFDPHGFNAAFAKPWYSKPFALIGAGGAWFLSKVGSVIGGRPDPMQVYKESHADPFDHNLNVALHTDLARFIEGRLELMTRNGKTGLVLVVISLMLFLNWRVAFWAAVGLPVSFFGTFIIMWALGATINLLTLFGLIIVLGIIVDDAIVIGENIYRHVEEGVPPLKAAVKGTEEVMWPVTIAVLTTIAAFAPLFFIRGQIGDFMGQLPIVVLAALSVSLIEALLILPAHLAHLPSKAERERKRLAGKNDAASTLSSRLRVLRHRMGGGQLSSIYERVLRFTLRWRYVTIAVSVSVFIAACGLIAGGVVERVFIQEMDSETLICSLEMPVGTSAQQVKDRLGELARLAADKKKMPEVVNVQSFVARQYDMTGVGATGVNAQSHLGQLVIELKPADQREQHGERSSMDLLTVFRRASDRLAGVNSVAWEALSGGPGGKDIHIKVTGENFSELTKVAAKLKQALRKIEGVYDLDDNIDRGKREVQIEPTGLARIYGVSKQQLGEQIRSALYGRESRRLTRNREDVKIMVRYPKSSRETLADLESVKIPVLLPERQNPPPLKSEKRKKWAWIPLKELAKLNEIESLSTINRSQQKHSVSVFGAVDKESGTNTSEVLEKIHHIFDTTIQKQHPDVHIEFLGSFEEQTKAFGGLKVAFPVAFLMIFMLLAGLFRSYVQPLVVMAAIPFGFLGALIGHWITGNPMTILSWIGLVALTGIVVNDSLVLVSFINTRIRSGVPPFEANIQGAKLRLRAILLTTLTTVAGLSPLMFETSFQAKFLIPMAVTLTFGLVFATALTLVIVPSLNMIFFDLRTWFTGGKESGERTDAYPADDFNPDDDGSDIDGPLNSDGDGTAFPPRDSEAAIETVPPQRV